MEWTHARVAGGAAAAGKRAGAPLDMIDGRRPRGHNGERAPNNTSLWRHYVEPESDLEAGADQQVWLPPVMEWGVGNPRDQIAWQLDHWEGFCPDHMDEEGWGF